VSNPAFEDAFNLLCHHKLGSGIHRDVFECRINPQLVVKVENDLPWRYFANVLEMKFWNDNQDREAIAKWLAPCEYLSPDGLVLLQRRCEPLRDSDQLPEKLPSFLTDVKKDNYGLLDGRIVCFDYALNIPSPSTRPKKVIWS
jgi:hypothetical protein